MKTEITETRGTLYPCPRCAKPALAQRDVDRYHCLWCGFSKDLSVPEWDGIISLLSLLGFLGLLLLL